MADLCDLAGYLSRDLVRYFSSAYTGGACKCRYLVFDQGLDLLSQVRTCIGNGLTA